MKKLFILVIFFAFYHLTCYSQFQIGFITGNNHLQIYDPYEPQLYSKHTYSGIFYPSYSFLFGTFIKDYRFKQPVMTYEISYNCFTFGTRQIIAGPGATLRIDLQYKINYLFFTFSPEFVFGSDYKILIKPGLIYGKFINCYASGRYEDNDYFKNPRYTNDTFESKKDNSFSKYVFGIKLGIGFEYALNKSFNLILTNNIIAHDGTSSWYWGSTPYFISSTFEMGISYNFKSFIFFKKSKK